MFPEKVPFDEIAKTVGVKIDTVHRYHQQWKKDPGFERLYLYVRTLFQKTAPDREKNLELFARAWGISKEDLETILFQPHGLRRLMTGKIYMPGHEAADHKRSKAFELALLITDHLIEDRGNFEDIYLAIKHYTRKYMEDREQEDTDIEEENKWLEVVHAIIAAEIEQERKGRVKPDTLTEQEHNVAIRIGIENQEKKTVLRYWINIGELMAQGYTKEQARDKMVQLFIDDGKLELAERMRKFQDKYHPLKNIKQEPPESPPQPLSPT
jgi:hypothetical protein